MRELFRNSVDFSLVLRLETLSRKVSKCVGHSTIQMTMRYAHLMPGANQIANSVADAFYANTSQKDVGTDTDADSAFLRRRISL